MTERRVVTLIALLRRTSRLMVEEVTVKMERAGYPNSPPGYHLVFENIDPEGTRLTVLAARAGVTHQAISQIVDELERRRFVERSTDPSDGRARLVHLTEEGRRLVRTALREISAIEEKWRRRWRDAGLDGDIHAALQAALREEDMHPKGEQR
jgi:DNA-binding MarR family transcriptional regulator